MLKLVLAGGLKLVVIGVTLGLAGAFALTRVLQAMLFGVTAHDPLVFIGNAALRVEQGCALGAARRSSDEDVPEHRGGARPYHLHPHGNGPA